MKKLYAIIGGLVGSVLIIWGLIFIAQGESYDLAIVDPAIGPNEAPILIEEFSDFECPACGANAPILKEALQEYPTQVKFVYKDFPLSSIHPQAREAAAGVLCAAQQGKFQEFHDGVFAEQSTWSGETGDITPYLATLVDEQGIDKAEWETCIASRQAKKAVDADFSEGRSRGVNSTPTFFLNGELVQTPQSVFQWIQLINTELEAQGLTPENALTADQE